MEKLIWKKQVFTIYARDIISGPTYIPPFQGPTTSPTDSPTPSPTPNPTRSPISCNYEDPIFSSCDNFCDCNGSHCYQRKRGFILVGQE